MQIRTVTATAAVAVLLTACGGGESESGTTQSASTSSSTSESTPSESSASESESPESTETEASGSESGSAAGGEMEEVEVGESVEDPELGNTVEVTKIVRDFASEDFANIAEDGGEIVLVEIDAKAGDEFSGGVNGPFKLRADGTDSSSTSIVDDELEAAGMTPFDGPSRGEEATGWLAFQINTRADSYEFVYTRLAAKVIGSDKTFPKEEWTIELP
ncbi:hypothetical protein EEW87_015595 [Janibacter melonis]|uniref:DUF4352 domain-containing protein n=1 Tax=Janibacter melonis TaxID=262209 RepID=A0A5P8FPD8_9MICO|nr:hypothetical protein [Janibacter melonis]QFQ31446.2 hypothetical protein EEW87_015595 [Janibacter melonis]